MRRHTCKAMCKVCIAWGGQYQQIWSTMSCSELITSKQTWLKTWKALRNYYFIWLNFENMVFPFNSCSPERNIRILWRIRAWKSLRAIGVIRIRERSGYEPGVAALGAAAPGSQSLKSRAAPGSQVFGIRDNSRWVLFLGSGFGKNTRGHPPIKQTTQMGILFSSKNFILWKV